MSGNIPNIVNRREFLRGTAATIAAATGYTSLASAQEAEGEAFTTERQEIESHDGATLVATLYEPTTDGPHPAVLMTHGWGGKRQDREPLASFYAANGYVVLAYDSRGFGESGGQVTSTGPDERDDARELITWLADHDAVLTDGEEDPRIGMDGFSYGGGIQFRTAAVDDRLDALVPRITWHDLAQSLAPNGVVKWGWYTALNYGARGASLDPDFEEMSNTILGTQEMSAEQREFYHSRSPRTYIDDVETPALIINGWHDRLFFVNEGLKNYRNLKENGVETRFLIHNTGHDFDPPERTDTESEFIAATALSWMNAHLRDGDHDIAPVNYYDAERDEWVAAESFPPADTERETFPLADGGSGGMWILSNDPTLSDQGMELTVDFPVEERTELVGIPELRLVAGPTGDRTRLAIGLEHVDTEGNATLIKDQVTAVAVDEAGELELELPGIQQHFEAGERLRLRIAVRDQLISDVPQPTSDSGLYVDSDDRAGAFLIDNPSYPATLSVPLR